jgi:hypothetical protein
MKSVGLAQAAHSSYRIGQGSLICNEHRNESAFRMVSPYAFTGRG